jgi:tetratricopeptide (TPR) repeat protein
MPLLENGRRAIVDRLRLGVAGIVCQRLRCRSEGGVECPRLEILTSMTQGRCDHAFPFPPLGTLARGTRQIALERRGAGVCGPDRPHLGQRSESLRERARLQPFARLFEQPLDLAVLQRGPHLLEQLHDAPVMPGYRDVAARLEAARASQQALARDLLNQGQEHERRGAFAEAQATYERARQVAPAFPGLADRIGAVRVLKTRACQKAYDDGLNYYNAGRLRDAGENLTRALALCDAGSPQHRDSAELMRTMGNR